MSNFFKKITIFSIICITLVFFSGCSIVMPVFHNNFDEDASYTVTLTTSIGGTVSGEGVYVNGDNVTVEAISDDGYQFVSWKNGNITLSTNPIYQFIISSNITLTAQFELISYYTVSILENLHGTVLGAGTYLKDTQITLRAIPDNNYVVIAWIINDINYETNVINYPLVIDKNYTVRVMFDIEDTILNPIE